jgi:ABC-type multidrug transport system permease subunit
MSFRLQGVLATCSFELRRSLTAQRLAVSTVLALFPPTMLWLLIFGARYAQRQRAPDGTVIYGSGSVMVDSGPFISVFLIALVLLLSLLLWATPNVYSELEGKSWTFVASRPGGRISIFLGKFLASVLVSFSISLVGVSLCVWIIQHNFGAIEPARLWLSMNAVYFLATLIYSALFSMIGVLFVKRAMVVGAGFLIGFDVFLASLPGALINRFTVRHHLQEIGIATIGWFFPTPAGSEKEYRFIYGNEWPVWIHVGIILIATIVFLAIGIKVISSREYVTSDQN